MGRHSARDGQDGRDSGRDNGWDGGGADGWDMGWDDVRDSRDSRDNAPDSVRGGGAGDSRDHMTPPGVIHGTLPRGAPGSGRRRRADSPEDTGGFAVIGPGDGGGRSGAHPEHREHSAWGSSGGWGGQGAGRAGRRGLPQDPVEEWAADWAPYDTDEMMRPTQPHAVRDPGAPPARSTGQDGRIPRPRQEFLDAFDAPAAPQRTPAPAPPRAPAPAAPGGVDGGGEGDGGDLVRSGGVRAPGGRGRMLSGVAAAAVVTVLAVVVGGQALHERHRKAEETGAPDADAAPRGTAGPASRSEQRTAAPAPSATPTAPAPTYDDLMARQYPLDARLALAGAFTTVPGHQAAPGKGKVVRFRVDVERGLPLDAGLFSDAVFRTLNDPRSWGHGGAMTFERVSSGPADIVVTLASPGTTDKWCAKSGLDTSVDNVSCDSASTPRTMINAFRWAQGAATYGPALMHQYRQMLINHEVGHRLGHDHTGCPKAGAPAPVMMQQTKFLSLDGGPTCEPNPWPFP